MPRRSKFLTTIADRAIEARNQGDAADRPPAEAHLSAQNRREATPARLAPDGGRARPSDGDDQADRPDPVS